MEKIMQRVTALTLLKYKRWMDAGMLSAIAETDARRFRAERREMLRLMYHMHATDMLIRANLKGEAPSRPNIRPRRPPEQAVLVPCMLACSGWFIEYAAGMTAEAWDRPIIYQRRDEKMAQTSPLSLIEQVILHGTRHRGAVSWLIKACGIQPPQDVVSHFLRKQLTSFDTRG
ncbi:DinB family protein [Pantoea sp. Al-1710]|uniref:DinB family protein n=1 Tax=Candidatus Pantoea communis TaxID=2608354 RepID=A0ABX0RXV1_9GAMM|nr:MULTISPECIES: DinB family protein [Enterobacterales]NIG22351.1 DinB family protein [Pantoea communis]